MNALRPLAQVIKGPTMDATQARPEWTGEQVREVQAEKAARAVAAIASRPVFGKRKAG